jgi:putative addiction module killer protein
MARIRIVEYLDWNGQSPFARWFEGLASQPAAKVSAALYRLGEGNFSNVQFAGAGVFERRIDSGPGYRVYFGKDGDAVVILLGGSTKRRQQEAIDAAQARWAEYRRRRRQT